MSDASQAAPLAAPPAPNGSSSAVVLLRTAFSRGRGLVVNSILGSVISVKFDDLSIDQQEFFSRSWRICTNRNSMGFMEFL